MAEQYARQRASKQKLKRRGLWYWMVVFPVKWCMLFMFGLVGFMLVASVAMIAAIPWMIVRSIQGKPLKPDFVSRVVKSHK